MSSRTALRTASAISDRTLYLRVKPAPSSLSERRAVLNALQQYGKIDVFKKLHDDSSFITVASSISNFWKVKKASPIQFDYQGEKTAEAVPDPRVVLPSSSDAASPQTFTVEAFHAPDYSHKEYIKRSPLYGPWPQQTDRSQVTFALMQVVPKNVGSRGLSDWETGAQMEDPDARNAWLTSKENLDQLRISREHHRRVLAGLDRLVNGGNGERRDLLHGGRLPPKPGSVTE